MKLYEVLEVCGSLYADFKCRDEHGRQCGGMVIFSKQGDLWHYQLFPVRDQKRAAGGGRLSEGAKRRLEIDNMARVALDQAFWRTRENSPEKDPLF